MSRLSGTETARLALTSMSAGDEFFVENSGSVYQYTTAGWVCTRANGAARVSDQGINGGGRNETSETNNYTVTHKECNKTFFNPDATTEQIITASPAFLLGFVGKVGTGTFTLRDSATVAGAATDFPVYTLAVGTIVTFPGDVRMESGITAQCGTPTDEVTIFWRPI